MYKRLQKNGSIDKNGLEAALKLSEESGRPLEQILLERGVPKCEALVSLSEHYGCPYIEYDEDLMVSWKIMRRVDAEELKQKLWMPISIQGGRAEVIASQPHAPQVVKDIKSTLGVSQVDFRVALPNDIVRIIENNQDLNPGFPPEAGRTPLARTRTYLAGVRSSLAVQRTSMAKARTALAFLRTGISLITIGVAFIKLFGAGLFLPLDLALIATGAYSIIDGLKWYIPARSEAVKKTGYQETAKAPEMTVLLTHNEDSDIEFSRTKRVSGAGRLRRAWGRLSPVMRRRFLANDRTDLAEGRTIFASMRTTMAQARTGLAFARSGVAFGGLGLGLFTRFPGGDLRYLDYFLMAAGVLMVFEGFYWYRSGYLAGRSGLRSFFDALKEDTIWDEAFPALHRSRHKAPPVGAGHSPGIWGTTGLALERTVLAERRNLMALVRTVMAHSRTGLSFIRTGMSIAGVGATLVVLTLPNGVSWKLLPLLLVIAGMILAGDGLRWCLTSERLRREYPYCRGGLEISLPDYGKPARLWGRVVFEDDF